MITEFAKYEDTNKSFKIDDMFDEELLQTYNDFLDNFAEKLYKKYDGKWIKCGFINDEIDENPKYKAIIKVEHVNAELDGIYMNDNWLLDLTESIIPIDDVIKKLKEKFIGKEITIGKIGKYSIPKSQIIVKDVIFREKPVPVVGFIDNNDKFLGIRSDDVEMKIINRITTKEDPFGEEDWDN